MADRCKHEMIVGTCATCLGIDHVEVPNPFEGMKVDELDPERDLGGNASLKANFRAVEEEA